MIIELPTEIDRDAWLGRLGARDYEGLGGRLEKAEAELLRASGPRGTFTFSDIYEMPGTAIKKHLADCRKMILMGVTLGPGVDAAIRSAAAVDMAYSLFLDSGASILIEQAADIFTEKLKNELPADMPYMTGRYSPGYGDLPIGIQDDLAARIDAQRRIGLTISKTHLMIPRKSITAIIGISDKPVSGYLAVCSECALRDKCELRKTGRICG
jgi:Methionine synthase I, cobalamin-binding domain